MFGEELLSLPAHVKVLVEHFSNAVTQQERPMARLLHILDRIEGTCDIQRHLPSSLVFLTINSPREEKIPDSWEDLELELELEDERCESSPSVNVEDEVAPHWLTMNRTRMHVTSF